MLSLVWSFQIFSVSNPNCLEKLFGFFIVILDKNFERLQILFVFSVELCSLKKLHIFLSNLTFWFAVDCQHICMIKTFFIKNEIQDS